MGGYIDGLPIYPPQELQVLTFDFVYVGVLTYYQEVMKRLEELHVPAYKIIDKYVSLPTNARIVFLENARLMLDEDGCKVGQVAELGVYKGDFAKEINRVFPDKTLYLFDTFGGFARSDDEVEQEKGFSEASRAGYFSDTSVEYVLSRMPQADKCVVRAGVFPDTARGLEEERFLFVNIDADLYEPIMAGLEWFYPRMSEGGIILVHDYYSTAFTGARQAVKDFSARHGRRFLPVGDTLSVALRA